MVNKKLVIILFVFLLPLWFYSKSDASGMGMPVNILNRIFLIKFKDDYGSAFTIEVDNRQYLITAKHIVEGIGDKGTILIFHDSIWKTLEVRTVYSDNSAIDIVVLIPPFQLSRAYDIGTIEEGPILGQDVYFLGFPYEMYQDVGDLNRKFPIPFVKKGILSAIKSDIWYVDGNSNRGFSGGPVVFFEGNNYKRPFIGAVVSDYYSEQAFVKDVKQNKIVPINIGSGILS